MINIVVNFFKNQYSECENQYGRVQNFQRVRCLRSQRFRLSLEILTSFFQAEMIALYRIFEKTVARIVKFSALKTSGPILMKCDIWAYFSYIWRLCFPHNSKFRVSYHNGERGLWFYVSKTQTQFIAPPSQSLFRSYR